MNERMRERLYVHGSDLSSLHEYVHKSHLPTKYGGELPEYPYTEWMESLAKNERVMDELSQLGYVFDQDDYWIESSDIVILWFVLGLGVNLFFISNSIDKYQQK